VTPDQASEHIDQLARRAYEDLLRRIRAGETPREAAAAALAAFRGPYYQQIADALNAILNASLGPADIKAWPVGKVKLSQALYAHHRAIAAATAATVDAHLQGLHSARDLAKTLYEGYDFKPDTLKVVARLPRYLRVEFDRSMAAKLKTPALRAAYLQAIQAAEAGAGQAAREKVLTVAFYERNRYLANRIARTEIARAQNAQLARELLADDRIGFVQIRLSSKHPRPDICDLHAKLDAYGLGPGVYPKADAPLPPFHPHCYCLQRPILSIPPGQQVKARPNAARAFLKALPAAEARQVMGGAERLRRVLDDGDSIEAVVNTNVDPLYHARRMGDMLEPAGPVVPIRERARQNDGMTKPERIPWTTASTDVDIVADTALVQGHPAYRSAKQGDLDAALQLVSDVVSDDQIARLREKYAASRPLLTGVHAVEGVSVNVIPQAMVAWLARQIGLEMENSLVQANRVGHTKASGWHRLAHQARFDGEVQAGRAYLLMDDFIGQGGTLANLRAFIEARGGRVVGAMALTGKAYSSRLALTVETLNALRAKHGDLESWWRERFGFGFESLTESEARYLLRAEDADTIRNRLAAAEQESHAGTAGRPGE
jgi:hypoxanthine-guanine phosphoribosyltransferase